MSATAAVATLVTRASPWARVTRIGLSTAAAIPPIVIAAIALLGWVSDSHVLRAVFVSDEALRGNTAVGVLLAGLGAVLATMPAGTRRRRLAPWLFGAVLAVGGATTLEYALRIDLGIDSLLFDPAPLGDASPRMALGSALGLTLLGLAGVCQAFPRVASSAATILGTLAATLAAFSLLGFLYHSLELQGLGAATVIALPTAVAIGFLTVSLLARPDVRGPIQIVGRPTRGGRTARALIALSLIALPLVGYLRVLAEDANMIGRGFGVAMTVAVGAGIISFAGLIIGRWLDNAEAARTTAEAEAARMFDLSADPICAASQDGYFERLNPAWTAVLGYTLEELVARPFLEFVHPDDVAGTLEEFERNLQGCGGDSFVNRYRHADGTYRTIEWRSRRSEETGKVYASARDVTAQLADQRSRALLAAVVGSTDEAVMSFDLEGRLTSWNPGAQRLFGYSEGEVLGRDLTFLLPPERPDELRQRLAQTRGGDGLTDWDTVRVRKDGRRIPVMITTSRLRDVDGGLIGSTAIARDVSERNAARDRVQLANERLRARNEELRDFASVVSHDLRAPLRRVQMFADMAMRADPADPELPDLLSRIRGSTSRMEALVVDLVTIARVGSTGTVMRRVDLNETVAEALEELQPQLVEAAGIVNVGKLGTVHGDPILLRQLFVNLIGNAIKFRKPEMAPLVVVEDAKAGDGNVAFTVTDNGLGFEPEYAERIFRIFERLVPDAAPGTGVGLALCRKIVGVHFGAIVATSSPLAGATFTVTLPESPPQELLDAA